jgi:hypothetical protein
VLPMTESWHGQRVPTRPVDECSVRSDWNLAHQPKAAQARSVPSTSADGLLLGTKQEDIAVRQVVGS